MSKIIRYTLLVLVCFFLLFAGLVFWGFKKISYDLGQSPQYLLDLVTTARLNYDRHQSQKTNFIVLGLDKRDDQLEKTQTTDTIIFVSLDYSRQKISLVSLPRDLWFYDLNTKINQIYPLSLNEPDSFEFIKAKFKQLTGQSIDHVLVLTTDNLIDFVDLIGGVDLVLDQGFVDDQYPNPEYINNPSPKIPIYKTVEFKSGPIHLDKTNVTEFVRSRKGGQTAAQGGTDLARIHRQQLLIEAILDKIKSGNFIQNYSQAVKLYHFWNRSLIKDISDNDIVAIISHLDYQIKNLTFDKINIPIGNTAADGLIYHPNRLFNRQWVFLPSDKDYTSFRHFFDAI
ncbi:MAG TPA: LCP family protein [Candidatus Woesebacteria bacterium]|jgi:LCP family protein required for cell wall assembly|nr:LCP family protein [Candidatus Woesebacteria bacterium]HOG37319.1 LCP family protein [Candidatus Woesebacteria bacterium]